MVYYYTFEHSSPAFLEHCLLPSQRPLQPRLELPPATDFLTPARLPSRRSTARYLVPLPWVRCTYQKRQQPTCADGRCRLGVVSVCRSGGGWATHTGRPGSAGAQARSERRRGRCLCGAWARRAGGRQARAHALRLWQPLTTHTVAACRLCLFRSLIVCRTSQRCCDCVGQATVAERTPQVRRIRATRPAEWGLRVV